MHPAGLANKVVPNGQSLHKTISLAEQLSEFPQECLRADRGSALTQALAGGGTTATLRGALEQERRRGEQVLAEATTGARAFSKGKGRHGSFQN